MSTLYVTEPQLGHKFVNFLFLFEKYKKFKKINKKKLEI